MKMKTQIIFILLLFYSSFALAWDQNNIVPENQRQRFRNPDGSCVQCSIGMMGVDLNVPAAEMLLWNSEFGPAVRGGSWPERTKKYCAERNIDAWHIEGDTMPWIEWALRNGRSAAVTLTTAHMQWVTGISNDGQTFYVVDNNSPQRIDSWSRDKFIQQHRIHGGGWAVILKTPARVPWAAPQLIPWWQTKTTEVTNEGDTFFSLFGAR